jgi:hypothetical protein
LLIAGYFSFFNAGSGSNQSNHMYKLGPCHQGILERGAKTSSDSYLLYPFKIGAFSLVMGRHYKHCDISNLPYSYLIESKDESILIPGVNLRSVGTIRDAMKWPRRDKRTDPEKLDLINFDLLSPYTVNKMIAGKRILQKLQQNSGKLSEFYSYNNVKIKNHSLKKGLQFYKTGLIKFLGNTLINHLEGKNFSTAAELTELMKPTTESGSGPWVDIAGMFAPLSVIEDLLAKIPAMENMDRINAGFAEIHNQYAAYRWKWFLDNFEIFINKQWADITPDDLVAFIQRWQKTVKDLDNQYMADCHKEFSEEIMVGYGIDGDEDTQQADFAAVRGEFQTNSFVEKITTHQANKEKAGHDIIEKLLVL